jgi:hypothetical protein
VSTINGPQSSVSAPSSGEKSIIGNDLKIIGQGLRIIGRGSLQVDGEIEGDVHAAEVIVGEKGQVTGMVAGRQVVVRGKVSGVICGQTVALQGLRPSDAPCGRTEEIPVSNKEGTLLHLQPGGSWGRWAIQCPRVQTGSAVQAQQDLDWPTRC